jgi:hypothetical protein
MLRLKEKNEKSETHVSESFVQIRVMANCVCLVATEALYAIGFFGNKKGNVGMVRIVRLDEHDNVPRHGSIRSAR